MNENQTGFRGLEVWQIGRELAIQVYIITKSFPKDEAFGLTSQLRRSSVSIPSNIAEGWARQSDGCLRESSANSTGLPERSSHSTHSGVRLRLPNQRSTGRNRAQNRCSRSQTISPPWEFEFKLCTGGSTQLWGGSIGAMNPRLSRRLLVYPRTRLLSFPS